MLREVVLNVYSSMKYLALLTLFVLSACGSETDTPAPNSQESSVETADEAQTWVNPHPKYCHIRTGQIGAKPKQGAPCEISAFGAGAYMADLDRPERNGVTVSVSTPALMEIGVGGFSFTHFTFGADPKFKPGVETMDQVRVEWWEVTDLPNNMASATDATGENSLFSHTSPDAAHMKEQVKGQIDLTGYEIASAVLSINRADDIPLDDFAANYARAANMVSGQQYIEGTIAFSLIPMGSQGEQYGPTTFEFGTLVDWGYVKGLK